MSGYGSTVRNRTLRSCGRRVGGPHVGDAGGGLVEGSRGEESLDGRGVDEENSSLPHGRGKTDKIIEKVQGEVRAFWSSVTLSFTPKTWSVHG